MDPVTLSGIDLDKHSFHLHGQDAKVLEAFCKRVSRKQRVEFFAKCHPCAAAMGARASAHYVARKFIAGGHEVKLISPQ